MIFNRIIIIGCGPAGMACAIQLKRMGLESIVIEEHRPGGMLVNANRIENYPGFPGGISGPELASRIVHHFHNYQITVHHDKVLHATFADGSYILESSNGTYGCKILVIATGTNPSPPDYCPGDMVDEGLVHFEIKKLRQFSGKKIGIIGAGDAAFDYGLTMAENKNDVFIFNRGKQVRALQALSEKVFNNNTIKYLENTSLEKLETIQGQGLQAIFKSPSPTKNYLLDYLIFATGRKPALEFLDDSFRAMAEKLVNEHMLCIIGDVKNGGFRQVSVAVGDGVRAAMEIFQYESNQQNNE